MQLRKYQSDAIASIEGALTLGETNIVLEAPTGSGKSIIISELCNRLDGHIVIMVNIAPLIDQISEHLKEMNIDHSILKAGREDEFSIEHKVQIVMSQTFYARYKEFNMHCDYMIIDERHKEYDTLRTKTMMYELTPKAVIGLTATPYDQAGCKLRDAYMINTVQVKELTELGFLSPVRYYVPKWSTELGLEDLKLSGVDYNGKDIDEKFNNNIYYSKVLESMNQMDAKNKKTLVFCNSIKQCDLIAKCLKEDGYDAAAIHSEKHTKTNDEILEMFKFNKGISCLVSVSKLNVGFDVRDVELGVMLRPTKVRSLYIQTVGRLTRTSPSKVSASFLDLSGVVMEHGFHDEPYMPPTAGMKKEIANVKEIHAAPEVQHIVSDVPTEITRVDVNVFIEDIRRQQQDTANMTIEKLGHLFNVTNSIYDIISIAYRINEIKTGTLYKDHSVDWVTDKWISVLQEHPEHKARWVKALKTSAQKKVREGKNLNQLYYFADFLVDNKDEVPSNFYR